MLHWENISHNVYYFNVVQKHNAKEIYKNCLRVNFSKKYFLKAQK